MKRTLTIASMLFAAAGWAQAQTTTIPATDPGVAGQASTQTRAGVPNPPQRPDGVAPKSRAEVRQEARVHARHPDNTNTPGGEPSTMRNSRPNAMPPTGALARNEVKADARAEASGPHRQFGQTGERPAVPTNPKDHTGTPK